MPQVTSNGKQEDIIFKQLQESNPGMSNWIEKWVNDADDS